MNQDKDLFFGLSVPKAIAKYAIPTILSQLITLIYNLADTFFVGRTNDPSQVAALTLSFPLFMLLTMVGNLFGIGANSYISRSLGAGQKDNAKKASTFAFYGAIFGVLIIIAILFVFMSPILKLIGAGTVETFNATKAYLIWTVVIGGIPTVSSLILGHLIRSEGNTLQASIGMAVGGILNIVLDYVFVFILPWGAKGAAIATCISNVVGFLYLLQVVLRTNDTIIVLNPAKFRFEFAIAKQVILVGIPAAAIIILGTSANLLLTHFMSVYGDVSLAAMGITQKVGSVAIQITVGLTQGIMPLLGYSYGAGDIEKFKEISRYSFLFLGIYASLCLIIVQVFAREITNIFISDAAVVSKCVNFIHIWFYCAPGMCFTNLFCSIFQSTGKWLHSLLLSVIRQGLLLAPLLIILDNILGEKGLVSAQPISDTIALIMGVIIYILLLKQFSKTKGTS